MLESVNESCSVIFQVGHNWSKEKKKGNNIDHFFCLPFFFEILAAQAQQLAAQQNQIPQQQQEKSKQEQPTPQPLAPQHKQQQNQIMQQNMKPTVKQKESKKSKKLIFIFLKEWNLLAARIH